MTLTRLLGIVALGLGGSLPLTALLLGQDLVVTLTGVPLGLLYGACFVTIALGAVAVKLGMQEERDCYHSRGGEQ